MSEQQVVSIDDQPKDLHQLDQFAEVHVRGGVNLRPLEEADAPAIVAILQADPTIKDRVTVASRISNEEDVVAEVDRYKKDGSVIRFAIEEQGKCVGLVSFWRDTGFFGHDARPNTYGFGYFLDPAERGKGLITDSVRTLMETANANLKIDSFIAFCEDSNQESVAVLNKLGLEPTDITYPEPTHGWVERMYEKKAEDVG
jgi:RimJ/RimL family protein N-acetyltransferase